MQGVFWTGTKKHVVYQGRKLNSSAMMGDFRWAKNSKSSAKERTKKRITIPVLKELNSQEPCTIVIQNLEALAAAC